MRAHLCPICGVTGDKDIPSIWREMALAQTKAECLTMMSQFFLKRMSTCMLEF